MEFTFKVTEQEANLIAIALMELPYKTVSELVAKINKQAFEQRQAAEPLKQIGAQ